MQIIYINITLKPFLILCLDCFPHPCAPPTDNTELIMTSRRAVLSRFLLFLDCVMKFNACHTDLSLTRTHYEAMMPNTTSHAHSVSLHLEASSDIVLSMIHKCDSLNHKAKRSVCKLCRLSSNKENSYYNISPLTTIVLLLMKSGDVSPNPGPSG